MELADLATLFDEARRRTRHHEYVVMGSLSVLGVLDPGRLPARMLVSIDVDCFARQDPGRIFELGSELGQGSAFEAEHGFYLDPIAPELPTLPGNWRNRLVRIPLDNGIVVFFLDPNDAAVSKYARGEPRDREWIRAGLGAGVLNAGVIASRFRETDFLDDDERSRAEAALGEDRALRRPTSAGS
ncbi:MAG: DUF6036 family nucleotidyltransferase [Burkholderiales bacterium]